MNTSESNRPRLLLVDDDEIFLDDVTLLLERDFECVCETDPDAAVGVAESAKPDAVLLDLDFDGVMLGFDVLAELRKAFPTLRIFLWTDANEEDVWPRGRELGATGLLSKTTPPREILKRLADARSPDPSV